MSINIDYANRLKHNGERSKLKHCNFKLPYSCVDWVKVHAHQIGFSEAEIIQCCIAYAAMNEPDATFLHTVETVKMVKRKTAKARPVWIAASEDGLLKLDIVNAEIYGVTKDEMFEKWAAVRATHQRVQDAQDA